MAKRTRAKSRKVTGTRSKPAGKKSKTKKVRRTNRKKNGGSARGSAERRNLIGSATPAAALVGISARKIYAQLKRCLSSVTGFPVSEIFTTDSLAGKFHFNSGGLRALAGELEGCFAKAGMPIPTAVSRDKMEGAKTVGDIADILNEAFGV